MLMDFLTRIFFGNSVAAYIVAIIIFVLLRFIFTFLEKLIGVISAKKQENKFWNFLDVVFENINTYTYILLSIFVPLQILHIRPEIDKFLDIVFWCLIWIEIVKLTHKIVSYFFFELYFTSKKNDIDQSTKNMFSIVIKILIWVMWILLILVNAGIEVTPLLAWLGVWWIAIWFALQNILSDIFASFGIFLDKPYRIWDYISVGDDSGTVQDITLKSTRIRSNTGQTIVIPNKQISNEVINNYSKVQKRRKIVALNISHDNEQIRIRNFIKVIQKDLSKIANIHFLRAVFKEYAEHCVVVEICYEVLEIEYTEHLNKNEEVNNKIFELLKEYKIAIYKPVSMI